jgi:hypothetical protein
VTSALGAKSTGSPPALRKCGFARAVTSALGAKSTGSPPAWQRAWFLPRGDPPPWAEVDRLAAGLPKSVVVARAVTFTSGGVDGPASRERQSGPLRRRIFIRWCNSWRLS